MQIEATEYKEQLGHLLDNHSSFEICNVDIGDMFDICGELEQAIENKKLKCRIYTKNRVVAGLAGVFNYRWGLAPLVAIAAHNIITRNPDYEIVRDLANNSIEVSWVG